MVRTVIGQNPRFRLKGVDPTSLIARYQAGEFINVTQPPSKVKTVNTQVNIVAPTFGNNHDADVYQLKDRNGKNIIMATSNCKMYEMYTLTGQSLPLGGRCWWCLQDYLHEGTPAPVAYRRNVRLEVGADGKTKIIATFTFWGEMYFCDMECMFAWCKKNSSLPPHARDPSYRDACSTARLMFSLAHPDKGELKEAQDPRLIKENGGSIPYSEYKANRHTWQRSPNVIVAPAKVPYQQIS